MKDKMRETHLRWQSCTKRRLIDVTMRGSVITHDTSNDTEDKAANSEAIVDKITEAKDPKKLKIY